MFEFFVVHFVFVIFLLCFVHRRRFGPSRQQHNIFFCLPLAPSLLTLAPLSSLPSFSSSLSNFVAGELFHLQFRTIFWMPFIHNTLISFAVVECCVHFVWQLRSVALFHIHICLIAKLLNFKFLVCRQNTCRKPRDVASLRCETRRARAKWKIKKQMRWKKNMFSFAMSTLT